MNTSMLKVRVDIGNIVDGDYEPMTIHV